MKEKKPDGGIYWWSVILNLLFGLFMLWLLIRR